MVLDAKGNIRHTWQPTTTPSHPYNSYWGVALHPTLGVVATGACYTEENHGDPKPKMLTMIYGLP